MKKTIGILACAALLGSAFLCGCNKIDGNNGKYIRFSAIAQGVPSTKTAYNVDANGNDVIETNGKQRIAWITGDKIRIFSDNAVHRYDENRHYADYVIKDDSVTNNGSTSSASIDNALDNETVSGGLPNGEDMKNGLIWTGASSYKFWGIYPSTAVNSNITLGEAGAVTATLPSSSALSGTTKTKTVYVDSEGKITTQTEGATPYTYKVYQPDMTYAYMTAGVSGVKDGKDFTLEFNPAYTAFEINLTSADENFTVSKVELVGASDKLSGKYSMTAGDLSTVVPDNSASTSVAATMTADLTTTSGVTFTLFALPKTNTGTISLVITTDKGKATLQLTKKETDQDNNVSYSTYQFIAGQKYRINLLKIGNLWKIFISTDILNVEDWSDPTNTELIVE